jgi:hypothetical protein
MNGLFNNKVALSDWTKVRDLADVYQWHCKHTPWLGKQTIQGLMEVYVRDMILLEKGQLNESRTMQISEMQRLMMMNDVK